MAELRSVAPANAAQRVERPASDLFAAAASALVDRLYAWNAEPMAECTTSCRGLPGPLRRAQRAGSVSGEFPFMFLPRVLWPRIVAKLRADQA